MKRERNFKPSRKMNPAFLVFCEGETEEAYINFIKQKYHLSVKVHITGLAISADIIKRYIKEEKSGGKVISFLMYDLDREDIIEKIASCEKSAGSISIVSNPSTELWFLLHTSEQHAEISTDDCIKKLKKSSPEWEHYEKGYLSEKQKQLLWNNCKLAVDRAKKLPEGKNPSSSIYKLIEEMEKHKK